MIALKTAKELEKMRQAGMIAASALQQAGKMCRPGVSTYEIDRQVYRHIVSFGATPSFLHYQGYPASACISVNDTVIHGIPSKEEILKEGDIVSIDIGAYYQGYHGDNAATFPVGKISEEAEKLLKVTKNSLLSGIRQAIVGNRLGDISHAVEETVSAEGFGIVRDFVGHGVGKELHESPEVPNFGKAGHGVRLSAGMVIAIEPMINLKGDGVYILDDSWTVKTQSGSLSAHFEHTIAITEEGPQILTAVQEKTL